MVAVLRCEADGAGGFGGAGVDAGERGDFCRVGVGARTEG